MTADNMPTIEAVELGDIEAKPADVQIRASLNGKTVDNYTEILELLPPIDVFRVEGEAKLILADGFHRFAAHQKMGRHRINATIHAGTMDDAREFAAVANMANARSLTQQERNNAVRRVKYLNPKAKQADIAKRLGVSQGYVSRVLAVEIIQRQNDVYGGLPDTTVMEVLPVKDKKTRATILDYVAGRGAPGGRTGALSATGARDAARVATVGKAEDIARMLDMVEPPAVNSKDEISWPTVFDGDAPAQKADSDREASGDGESKVTNAGLRLLVQTTIRKLDEAGPSVLTDVPLEELDALYRAVMEAIDAAAPESESEEGVIE